MLRYFAPVALLMTSNLFMTYAWHGPLKDLRTKPLMIAVGVH